MLRWLAPLIALLLSGCQQMAVNTDFDPYVEFANYRTFDWMPEKSVDLPADQQLLSQRLKYTVEQELRNKGIVRDESAPDFLISYYGDSQKRTSERLVEHGNYWGDRDRYDHYRHSPDKTDPRYWNTPPEQRTRINYTRSLETQTITYTEGTLVIDFLDAESRQVVWQSNIRGVLSNSDPMKSVTEAVQRALTQFPPQR
ncbi:DUF4136 domain-containing protein [Motiliproteus sediminis]|uniref:DUF4136 domain-containing protein n=1 Tax=Motiliproteus sediminis TaxID=1468178 RepID=UPI001AEFC5BD|nr:DUF4136 domain-containing protein [Motiliproteus sediminis]